MSESREIMDCDVLIVGAGPAGLATAIRLAQSAKNTLNICVIEKASRIGDHILSGAVLETRSLDELLPNWRSLNPPSYTPVTKDAFLFLTQTKKFTLPTPPQMKNEGNVIISLGEFCRFLGSEAEKLGVNIFSGFSGVEIVYEHDRVIGVITDDKGIDKGGQKKAQFQPGIFLRAKQTVFAEGCRGSLTEQLFKKFNLRKNACPQTFGLGLKEIWEIPKTQHEAGRVMHSVGWPLDQKTYGGSFIYHFDDNLVSVGFVVGLDYQNPYLNPYEEFQRFKTHPAISPIFKNGKRIAYGARTLVEGGVQSLPTLTFKGGLIVGDAAGFLNVPKIKGTHTAIKSGMLAAESLSALLKTNQDECVNYETDLKKSWIYKELYRARNIRPAFRFGLWRALIYSAIDTYLFRGRAPWTFKHKTADHETLKKSSECKEIQYPKHDNILTFDKSTSVFLTGTVHDENEPCHLILKNKNVPISINLKEYASPETRYCPAGVYEILENVNHAPYLQINAANCIHCKACDIKDPTQNIVWVPPEGGEGPHYLAM